MNRRWLMRSQILLLFVFAVCVAALPRQAVAQGGPPLVTDDPETPGNGHWEINLAATGAHTSGQWDIAAPDVDINYGWGEHVQMKLDVPWLFVHETDQPWKSSPADTDLGIN